ncbi:hypothetical protein Scep_015766 [Stephania cephalantha]|uniref:RRM domain-containing protein n=1 Tax=Stephania cephalantha TaxID=152367 RepID=A0AAP0J4K6_9MAGN
MSSVDTSLDDLIRKNNSRDGRIIGGGSSSSTSSSSSSSRPGPTRRRFSSNRSATPYAPKKAVDQAPNASWLHGMFVDRALSMEADVKLYISNLDYGVSEEDLKGLPRINFLAHTVNLSIQELFSEIGGLKEYCIHHDKCGRSKGTAEVGLSSYSDAISAITRYDNVALDGKPMKIQILGANILIPAVNPPVANVNRGDFDGVPRSWRGKLASREQPPVAGCSKGGNGFGRGDRLKRAHSELISAKDLDADLDKYRAQAMKTN